MDLILDLDVQNDIAETDPEWGHIHQLITPENWSHWLTQWLDELNPKLSPINTYALGLRLTLDTGMKQFNSTFRHIDKATDVLAFASLEREGLPAFIWESEPLELGDIIISVETAQRQSLEHHHSFTHELAWLACHGLLHLLGWDHPTPERLDEMLSKQSSLLSVVGLI